MKRPEQPDNCEPRLRYNFKSVDSHFVKLAKTSERIEASSICRQQFGNLFADCFCAVHTHQLEFANTSLPTQVCQHEFVL